MDKGRGKNVSSLYRSDEDKAGIKERENDNHGAGKSKTVTCPPEKEEAAMVAFKHFHLI